MKTAALKRWPGWVALLFVVVALLAVGASRDDGPDSTQERAQSIAERVACPVCQGESVADSRNAASEGIRTEIRRLVDEGAATDAQILSILEDRYGGRILLVPRANGIDALVWALPATALVCAVAGLGLAFRRWRRESDGAADPTEDDRRLVAAALAEDADDE